MGARIYKTADGKRYVPHGHPDAAFLAYTQFDEVPADVLEQVEGGEKKAAKPADKSRQPSQNKAAGQAKDAKPNGEQGEPKDA